MKGTATSREERGVGDTAQPQVALIYSGIKAGLSCPTKAMGVYYDQFPMEKVLNWL